MNPILFGDAYWESEIPLKDKSLAQFILEDEVPLLHCFHNQLKLGATLLRTPTRHSTLPDLAKLGLSDKSEALHNIAVSSGKHAIAAGGFDALLAGVLGPHLLVEGEDREAIWERDYAESAIYMIDKGADCMMVEGINDFLMFQAALRGIKKVNQVPVPVSAFFRLGEDRPKMIEKLYYVAELLELEAIGLELRLSEVAALSPDMLPTDLALGIQLLGEPQPLDKKERDQAIVSLLKLNPTLILAGEGMESAQWIELKPRIQELAG
ncbi:MAG: hypothetical protein A2508_10555 [Candidatus Lambdaproteobacteria bacterium RIFOXYD12_FULL_49_8]|uniref:Hcy-binding domain-containing protein n=1 Tax=Candidatus Lambdaproteobacteria bacterium RIFOXYD2_FULL_50_16 TaxID=1817772 RepID=A0A1F6GER1_9PROT|nr:MAG: hypothetical protein A2527_03320 [Candidatus Lambdaproteobacteria bacterium RIFOXYD2_FULL_50_16]OGG97868.1 MAG: hypothetical protein A2508_10555 [Candidatus Lambdaproteobacteria bacterium RIFOXYD12_FULL_49_8]